MKHYTASDGRVVGPVYGQIFDLVAQLCRLLGLRVQTLDIVLLGDEEISQEALDWVINVAEIEDAAADPRKAVRLQDDAWIMTKLLQAYYGAIQGETPSRKWVTSEAVRSLFSQNRKGIERLIQSSMEVMHER